MSEPVAKLVCRNVWKVYGERPEQFFAAGGGFAHSADNSMELADSIRASGHIVAAQDVSFDVGEGEIFVIMGLSGSGKSTIVRCLSRLVEPTAGEVLLDGNDLLKASERELIEIRRHQMGMVFQNFGLLPHLTVLENVAFPLKVQGQSLTDRNRRAAEMVALVGLEGREASYPRQLSGGQQQRVGIARSLAVEPALWFLDEPFSALDPLIRRQMQDEFLQLQKMLNKTIVFITHDFLEALRVGNRIAIMKDGAVVQIGTPADVVMNPADDYVAEFTRDAPRVRIITAGQIAVRGGDELPADRCVPESCALEALLPRFDAGCSSLGVRSDDGQYLGQVGPQEVVAALARAGGAP